MVYIEEVVADNLIINGILLALTCIALKEKRVWYRLLTSAVIGTVFAVFLPFIDNGVIWYKIGALFSTVIFAIRYCSFKRFVLFTLTFSVISFALGGAAYGLFNMAVGENGILTYPQGRAVKYAVFGAVILLLGFSRQIGRFALRKRISASNEGVGEVIIKDKCLKVRCFNDSGNKLTDNVTSKPVLLLSKNVGAHYVKAGARTICVHTISGDSSLPVFTAEKFSLHTSEGVRVYEKLPVAVADRDFDGYDLIYNADALCA